MRQPPDRLLLDALFIPISVLGAQVAHKHVPSTGLHPTGDSQALGPGLGADDLGHIVIHYLDGQWR